MTNTPTSTPATPEIPKKARPDIIADAQPRLDEVFAAIDDIPHITDDMRNAIKRLLEPKAQELMADEAISGEQLLSIAKDAERNGTEMTEQFADAYEKGLARWLITYPDQARFARHTLNCINEINAMNVMNRPLDISAVLEYAAALQLKKTTDNVRSNWSSQWGYVIGVYCQDIPGSFGIPNIDPTQIIQNEISRRAAAGDQFFARYLCDAFTEPAISKRLGIGMIYTSVRSE